MSIKGREIKIYVTRLIPEAGIQRLREEGFIVNQASSDEPIPQQALITEAKKNQAIITVSSDKIDSHFLNECKHLDIISQFAAGYDNINIDVASKLGIPVGNTPNAMSEATADIAFGLMLAVSRKMFFMHKTIAKGQWGYFEPKAHLGIELKNKTLGIFGLGRIGKAMAERCRGAYQMNIIYCNRNPNPSAEKSLNARRVDFDGLLKESDIISVHSILSAETKGIFDKNAFAKMKRTAIFINTSRGSLHNEIDLINALETKIIWGAGLDVTDPEPMRPENPLLDMENVAILPHIGSATVEARNKMSLMAAENIIEYYKNGRIPHLLNPASLPIKKQQS